MDNMFSSLQIICISLVTILIRFMPFILFGKSAETPKFLVYLGKVLPMSIMGMLVVYCIRNISFNCLIGWVPTLIAIITIIVLHIWKRNILLSILGGTAFYMILINII